MIQTYKILNEIDRIDSTIFFELSAASVIRGHSQKTVKKHARLRSRQSVFSQRVVNDWNSLPAAIQTNTICHERYVNIVNKLYMYQSRPE